MDSLQDQIFTLTIKVDALHHMIERLSEKTSEIVSEIHLNANDGTHRSGLGGGWGRHPHPNRGSYSAAMEHKDILSDTDYPNSDSQSGDREMTPEIQIQRLTAQLTAAYNRIAALEEQLLSRRIHS